MLRYTVIASLDGYIADTEGDFGWAEPDEDVFAFVTELEAEVGVQLLGRRMFELMQYWDRPLDSEDWSELERRFAEVWQGAEKVVFSTTLDDAGSATRIERSFDADAVRDLVAAGDRDVSIGGPTLAAHAFRAGLVDECHVFLVPHVVGGGLAAFPPGTRSALTLFGERRFASGVVYLRYRMEHG